MQIPFVIAKRATDNTIIRLTQINLKVKRNARTQLFRYFPMVAARNDAQLVAIKLNLRIDALTRDNGA